MGHWLVTTARNRAIDRLWVYVLQAAIASLHADEPRDWPQIAALYGELARLTDSPPPAHSCGTGPAAM
jgi:predicted RNA polymerase sigma factor